MPFFSQPPINDIHVRTFDNLCPISEVIEKISKDKLLLKRLIEHHSLYDCSPKGTLLENIFVKIFNEDLGFGQIVNGRLFDWKPESHKIGADIIVPSLSVSRVSIKTGQMSKIGRKLSLMDIREDHRIEHSSHRLTQHKDFQSVKEFLNISHYDITFLLSPYEKRGSYFWTIMENIDFSSMEWVEKYNKKGNHSGWVSSSQDQGVIKAEIQKTMSAQLWIQTRLSSNKIIHVEEICG